VHDLEVVFDDGGRGNARFAGEAGLHAREYKA
jgi:hypothetical protein